jgi:hypothetical protein
MGYIDTFSFEEGFLPDNKGRSDDFQTSDLSCKLIHHSVDKDGVVKRFYKHSITREDLEEPFINAIITVSNSDSEYESKRYQKYELTIVNNIVTNVKKTLEEGYEPGESKLKEIKPFPKPALRKEFKSLWQDITTAPIDGTKILVSDGEEIEISYWHENPILSERYWKLSTWMIPCYWSPLICAPNKERERNGFKREQFK